MNKFLALIIMGSSLLVIDPGKNLSAQPQIELSQSVNGPAMLSQSDDFGYSVEYTINAMNIGDADGSYDLDVSFLPATDSFGDDGDKNFQIFMISATLAYAGGDDSQSATPMPASGTFGDTIKMLSAETLLAGNSETWTLTVFYMFNFPESAPDGRGRNEGGDFLLAEIDTRACSDSNPVPNTGFYTAVAGSSTEIDGSDNGSCTDIPFEQIDLDLSVDGPAVLNGYGNFNVSYTLVANNTGEGPGFYDVVTTFASGPGIEVLMSYLSFSGGTDQTGVVENPPATVENPAPLNQGGAWVAGELLLPGEAETWSIVVAYSVEPALTSAEGSDCDTTNAGGKNTGFNTVVEGSVTETDLTNNTACTGLQYPAPALPDIDLKIERLEPTIAKPNSTIDVVYLVTASNNGAAPGIYDLVSLQDSREFYPVTECRIGIYPGRREPDRYAHVPGSAGFCRQLNLRLLVFARRCAASCRIPLSV